MAGWTAAAIAASAAVSGGGSWLSGEQSASSAKEFYKHRYQWATKDMIKAGLNPMLAAGGSQPVPSAPQYQNIGEGAVRGATSAFQAAQLKKQTDANVEAAAASAGNQRAEAAGKELANTILLASPEYRQAAEALDPTGKSWKEGTSAGALTRYEATTETVKAQARSAMSAADLGAIQADIAKHDLTAAQVKAKYADELGALSVRYNRAMAKAAENNVPRTEADRQFWEVVEGWGKAGEFTKQFLFVIAQLIRAMRD